MSPPTAAARASEDDIGKGRHSAMCRLEDDAMFLDESECLGVRPASPSRSAIVNRVRCVRPHRDPDPVAQRSQLVALIWIRIENVAKERAG